MFLMSSSSITIDKTKDEKIESDSDFNVIRVEAVLNELANTLGNLLLRCTSSRMCPQNRGPNKCDFQKLTSEDK